MNIYQKLAVIIGVWFLLGFVLTLLGARLARDQRGTAAEGVSMNSETGTFHTEEEMQAFRDAFNGVPKSPPAFIIFAPGETVTIKEQEFVVCRTKNDRLILRSAKLSPTDSEKKIMEQYHTDNDIRNLKGRIRDAL